MNEIERFLANAAQNSIGYGIGFQELLNQCTDNADTDNVDIAYRNSETKAKCTPGTKAHDLDLSPINQQVLDKRLKAIEHAPTMQSFLGSKQLIGQRDKKGNFHELRGDREWQIACSLDSGDRLIMTPNHNPPPMDGEGNLDWSKVTSVTIEDVAADYHKNKH